MLRYVVILFVVLLAGNPVLAMEMILSRERDAIAVFLRMPFEQVESLFGRKVPGFFDENGVITYQSIGEGTFEQADELAQDVRFILDGQHVQFDAMSMMVHQDGFDVPFTTPFEAEIAISVCGVPIPETPPDPGDLVWIGGWYAYPVKPDADIKINFPQTGRAPITLVMRSFEKGQIIRVAEHSLRDGGSISSPGERRWFEW